MESCESISVERADVRRNPRVAPCTGTAALMQCWPISSTYASSPGCWSRPKHYFPSIMIIRVRACTLRQRTPSYTRSLDGASCSCGVLRSSHTRRASRLEGPLALARPHSARPHPLNTQPPNYAAPAATLAAFAWASASTSSSNLTPLPPKISKLDPNVRSTFP